MKAYIFCAYAFNSFKESLNIKIIYKLHHYRKKNDVETRPNPEIVLLKGWDCLLIVLKRMSTYTPLSVYIDMAGSSLFQRALESDILFPGVWPLRLREQI